MINTQETNVDAAEIDKFSAAASHWWDPTGEFRPLHEINPLRVNYIDEHCGGLRGKRVLDIGCGGGILTESTALLGANTIGIDVATASLDTARAHCAASGLAIEYREQTAESLASAEADSFDVVTCLEMLEHVPDPHSVVAACAKLVKPGGSVFLSTISRNPKAYLFAVLGAEYLLRLLPRGTHDYAKFIRPSELSAWARAENLDWQDYIGMHYNPLLRSYSLGPDLSVNYLGHFLRPLS